jgi:hypothetical protein
VIVKDAMTVPKIFGVVFIVLSIAGALVPGLTFCLYFGAEEGALAWHRGQIVRLEAARAK